LEAIVGVSIVDAELFFKDIYDPFSYRTYI